MCLPDDLLFGRSSFGFPLLGQSGAVPVHADRGHLSRGAGVRATRGPPASPTEGESRGEPRPSLVFARRSLSQGKKRGLRASCGHEQATGTGSWICTTTRSSGPCSAAARAPAPRPRRRARDPAVAREPSFAASSQRTGLRRAARAAPERPVRCATWQVGAVPLPEPWTLGGADAASSGPLPAAPGAPRAAGAEPRPPPHGRPLAPPSGREAGRRAPGASSQRIAASPRSAFTSAWKSGSGRTRNSGPNA